jgi:hypothetical protein
VLDRGPSTDTGPGDGGFPNESRSKTVARCPRSASSSDDRVEQCLPACVLAGLGDRLELREGDGIGASQEIERIESADCSRRTKGASDRAAVPTRAGLSNDLLEEADCCDRLTCTGLS